MKLSDPFEILSHEKHWVPAQSQLDAFRNEYDKLPLVHRIRLAVQKWRATGYESASETAKSLLKFWFSQDHIVNGSPFRFYFAQWEAMESIIYLYEVAEAHDKYEPDVKSFSDIFTIFKVG